MKRSFPMVLVALLAVPSFAEPETSENANCSVPHHPLRWQAAYCMARAGTDDLEAIQNTECMAQNAPPNIQTICSQNAYWKKKWCNEVIRYYKGKTVAACVDDRSMEPQGVAEGF